MIGLYILLGSVIFAFFVLLYKYIKLIKSVKEPEFFNPFSVEDFQNKEHIHSLKKCINTTVDLLTKK